MADYAELLACRALGLMRAAPSEKGFDARDSSGRRYEIKARRLTKHAKATHFSMIRGLGTEPFDIFLGILFDSRFRVTEAWSLPFEVVRKIATFVPHVNGCRVTLGVDLAGTFQRVQLKR